LELVETTMKALMNRTLTGSLLALGVMMVAACDPNAAAETDPSGGESSKPSVYEFAYHTPLTPISTVPIDTLVALINADTDMALTVDDDRRATALQLPNAALAGQGIEFSEVAEGLYILVDVESRDVLGTAHDSNDPGHAGDDEPVEVVRYTGDSSQHWTIEAVNGGVRILNARDGRALCPRMDRGTLLSELVVYEVDDADSTQVWRIQKEVDRGDEEPTVRRI